MSSVIDALKGLLPPGVLKAMFMKAVQWAATTASAGVAAFLVHLLEKHGFSATTTIDGVSIGGYVENIAECVGTAVTSIGALIFILWDAPKVDAKMKVTAAAAYDQGIADAIAKAAADGSQVQFNADTAKVAAVKAALIKADTAPPATKAAVVQALKAGTF